MKKQIHRSSAASKSINASTSKSTASERPDSAESSAEYRVGYRRPPRHTQFKKGKSGNPRGRPKGLSNFRTVVEQELQQKIPLRQGDKITVATKQRAFVLTLLDGALKRDAKATVAWIALLRSLGMLGEPYEPASTEPVTANDQEIIADFLRRHRETNEVKNTESKT